MPHISIINEATKLENLHPNEMILVFDCDGYYHYASENREKILGYSRDETYGRHYSDFVAPDYVSHAKLGLDGSILTGESTDSGIVLISKSGRPLRFRTIGVPITDPSDECEYLIVRARLV